MIKFPSIVVLAFSAMSIGLLQGCGGGGGTSNSNAALSPAAALGKIIFQDVSLSASGQMSCQSCHDPDHGHGSPFGTPVAFGGSQSNLPGLRNPPAIRYLKYNFAFSIAADGTPSGGFFWDGRVNSLREQAQGPFLNSAEMANSGPADVVQKLRQTTYASQFQQVFGANILNSGNETEAFNLIAYALERYQIEDAAFAPFTSKFDAVMQNKASFTDTEARGFALFNSPTKGNCMSCHSSTAPSNAPAALFTDFTYDSLGVPRNTSIPANTSATFFDMGLCGALDTQTNTYSVSHPGLKSRADLCGRFKVPSLRNVQTRTHFFHNGQFTTLEQVVNFYVTRDTDPFGAHGGTAWYPSGDKFDDLPNLLLATNVKLNVNTLEVPYNRIDGGTPALSPLEQQDLIAFLKTLTDGYLH
jgi:cytochrome c peroxidase